MGDTKKIYSAICGVMADVGAIQKEKRNVSQGFLYRGVDDVMNALQPAMVKHGVFVVPEVMECTREERTNSRGTTMISVILKVMYTFFADDGSCVPAVVIGEAMDTGDKATNKAMSVAYKYACFQVFSIPTEEMKDPDADSPEAGKKAEKKTQKKKIEEVPPHDDGDAPSLICDDCGGAITDHQTSRGSFSAEKIAEMSRKSHGRCLCWTCAAKAMKGKNG